MMSLNFGEIVEPSTRAFWDDYDEDEQDKPPFEPLEWIWFNDQDGTTEEVEIRKTLVEPFRMLIFEGQKVGSFVGAAILKGNNSPLLQLSSGTVSIFYVPSERLIVCVSEEIDPNLFGHITEKLAPWLDAAQSVTSVTLQPAVLYKGAAEHELDKVCFIKGLSGTAEGVGQLDPPNVLTGVAAGAVGYRKFRGKQAAVYGCYLDSIVIDSVSSEPILRLLKSIGLPCADRYELKFKNSSNLYM